MPDQPIPPVPISCGDVVVNHFTQTEQLKTVAPGPTGGFPPPGWDSIPEETRKEIMKDWARDRVALTPEGIALADAVKAEAEKNADNGTVCRPCVNGQPCPKTVVASWRKPWVDVDVVSAQSVSTPDGQQTEIVANYTFHLDVKVTCDSTGCHGNV